MKSHIHLQGTCGSRLCLHTIIKNIVAGILIALILFSNICAEITPQDESSEISAGRQKINPSPLCSKNDILTIGALTAGILAGVFIVDKQVYRELREEESGTLNKTLNNWQFGRSGTSMELLGRPEVVAGIPCIFYIGGIFAKSEKAKRAAVSGVEAMAVSGILTLGIKCIAGRSRPDDDVDTNQFNCFEGTGFEKASFPSGHTSTAFALAAVISDEYNTPLVNILSYGTAAAVGFGRVYQEKHWASDVLAGAALGIVVGKGISKWNKKKWSHRITTDGQKVYLQKKF